MPGPLDSPNRGERIWDLFHSALERPQDDRGAFLDRACGDDAELRREIDELIAAHEGTGHLDKPPQLAGDAAMTAAFRAPAAFAAGDVLAGRFHLVRVIGEGGMGTVYEAIDRELGSTVALKTVRADIARDPAALDRFRREINLARRVTHPNACRIFDLFHHRGDNAAEPGVAFLTMELLRGETLAERLGRAGPMNEPEAASIVEQIASALAAAHRVGIVHRDLKSSNVMLVHESDDSVRAVVTDFGLATLAYGPSASVAALTRAGQLLGTPAYMAPEQLEAGPVTPATDVYALGLLMYEMVCGTLPFASQSPLTVAIRRLREAAPSPRTGRPDLSRQWEETILRCLERDPANRFQTPAEVAAALQPGSSAGRVAPHRRRRRRLPMSLAVAALFLLVAAGVWMASRWLGGGRPTGGAAEALAFTQRDWVLVAHFANRTGEAVFDDAINLALERELNNSQFVNVVPRERVADALHLMKRPDDTKLAGDVLREVAVRDGDIRALVRGRVEKVGGTYIVSTELVEPAKGIVVASLSEEATAQNDVLPAVRRLSNRLRAAVGEELSRIEQTNQKLAQVTTPSLRALQLYSQADAVIAYGGKNAAAEELLKQAVQEDPEFASAYIHLVHAIRNQNRPPKDYLPYAQRAFSLATGASERERLFIRGSYYSMNEQPEKALANYQALIEVYPDHFWANANSGYLLTWILLRGEEAVPYFLRTTDLRPNDFMVNRHAGWNIAVRGNNLAAAQKPLERARALLTPELIKRFGRQATWVETFAASQAWVQGDVTASLDALRRLEQRVEAHPDSRSLQFLIADGYQALGRLRDAERLVKGPTNIHLNHAFFRNDRETVGRWRDAPFTAPPFARLEDARAVMLARAGWLAAAKAALPGLEAQRASDRTDLAASAALSIVRGEIALRQGKNTEAIALIGQGYRAERANGTLLYFLAAEALADAYGKEGDRERALGVLEDASRQKGRTVQGSGAFWLHAYWQLAKLYRTAGRTGDASRVEAELRKMLAHADADHPILVEMQRGTQRSSASNRREPAAKERLRFAAALSHSPATRGLEISRAASAKLASPGTNPGPGDF